MLKFFPSKTPEEKREKRIEAKCIQLLNTIENEYNELSVDEQVEAVTMFYNRFKNGKEKEVEHLIAKQLEIATALKKLL